MTPATLYVHFNQTMYRIGLLSAHVECPYALHIARMCANSI